MIRLFDRDRNAKVMMIPFMSFNRFLSAKHKAKWARFLGRLTEENINYSHPPQKLKTVLVMEEL